ncbi:YciI family protein [Kribbella sp. NBC_00709]|uniref:YciI family protein n=1 Tax=Kribbella sp. NBC_00709 TaxID=2975972 RepID=UPI002E2D076E|nr:YciI family protein [Kribbella sp. NBC_00709]
MRYLISVIDGDDGPETADELGAVDAFNVRLEADGYWVFVGGLDSPATAAVVDNRGAEAIITDGPFLESKEYLGGLWIIEAPDLDVALKLATEASKVCNRKLEIRPFADD